MSYAISGGNQKTIEAAEIILSQGGNAVDAAIAAYLVSFVSEPCMASLGASGFAMINDTKQVKMVDFFCLTPKRKKEIEAFKMYKKFIYIVRKENFSPFHFFLHNFV